jgi:outer membrane protease
MRHADSLSRSVHLVEKDVNLSRDIIKEAQKEDSLCMQYKQNENFWTDEDGVLYYQEGKGRPRIVIP